MKTLGIEIKGNVAVFCAVEDNGAVSDITGTMKKIRESIELLIKAKICNLVYSSDCSGLPLEATSSQNTYKLMFLDVGLVNHIRCMLWV